MRRPNSEPAARWALAAEYRARLERQGLDLAFADTEPDKWPDLFPGGEFDRRAAEAVIRRLQNQRGYADWSDVGTEPTADYLHRLATAGARSGPYVGEGLPNLLEIVRDQTDELRGWLKPAGFQLPSEIFTGVLPTGEFNARASPVPGVGVLILVNVGLMDLIFTVLKVNLAAASFPDEPPLITPDQATKVLAEAFDAYLYAESSLLAWALPKLPDRREEYLGYLLRRAEQLVIAHEMAHVSLGHVSTTPGIASPSHTQAMELDADTWAAKLMPVSWESPVPGGRHDEATYLALGSLCFLILAMTIEHLQEELGLEQPDATTHPGTGARAAQFAKTLQAVLPGRDPLRRATQFERWLNAYLADVLEIVRGVNRQMKRQRAVGR